MKNTKMQIVQEIIGLRYELDNYRNDHDWVMVRKIRLEIAKLEDMLSETYWPCSLESIYYNQPKKTDMTIQVQNVIRRLVAHHGYSATFVQNMGEGIYLYSIGGIMYRIRGDGTII